MPLYSCPHCETQNFYTRERVRLAVKVPLVCWKCGKSVKKGGGKGGEGVGRKGGKRKNSADPAG